MPIYDREQLQEALTIITGQSSRFGEATVATAVAVLAEQLATLPQPASEPRTAPAASGEQRKQITILFAVIDGFTRLSADPHNTAQLRQIDLLWQRIDETIVAHGGVVDKHMGDVIMGIFGAPVARENDPERAVRCALALRQLMAEYFADWRPLDEMEPAARPTMRVGINTGQVSLGQVGSDTGYTVIGDAVNVASRLKEAADEAGIYISQDTYRLVRHLFRAETLGEVSIKGRQTPVTVYRIAGALPRLFFPTSEGIEGVHVPMIGRNAELAALRKIVDRTIAEGRGGVITLMGDAGVGKSRLIREFHRALGEYPFKPTVFQGRTDQRLAGVSFSLMRDLFVRHFGIDEMDDAGTVEEKIIHNLEAMLPDRERPGREFAVRVRARAFGSLIGLATPAAQLQKRDHLHLAAVRELAMETILQYMEAVVSRSAVTIMFLEDIHWADDDSLLLLEKIAPIAAEQPLLVAGLARPTLLERRPDWPGEHPAGAFFLPMRPLDEKNSRELVVSILRKLPHIPTALSDLVVRSAAGNPYYVEELVRVLIEDGIIVPDRIAWHLRSHELTRLRVPGTLTGVLQARLDRLPDVERVTLQQAAVVGDEFWAGAVHLINRAARFPYADEQVTAALDSLERRDMIIRVSSPAFAGSHAYLFRHTMLREVAYESVLLRDRPGYHLGAVRWLESQVGDRTAEYAAPIAQHYEQAGHPAEAALQYGQAASRAEELHKPLIAIDYCRKALELLKNQPQYLDARLTILERLGRLLQRRGRMVEALDAYRQMHDSAELDGNLLGRARAKNAQATIYLELDDNQQALEAATQAERLARLTAAEIEPALAQLLQTEAAGRLGDTAGALAVVKQAIEDGRSLDAPKGMARGLALLAALSAEPDEQRMAIEELRALIETCQAQERAEEAAFARIRLGELLLGLGKHGAARESLERAIAGQRAAGDSRGLPEALRLLGVTVCRLGEASAAIDTLEEAASLAEATGNRYLRLACRLALGEALLARGQYPAAEATLRQVIAAAEDRRRLGSWAHLGQAYDLLVEVLNRQGRVDEARLIVEKRVKIGVADCTAS